MKFPEDMGNEVSSIFLKLKDGQTVKGVFRGDIKVFTRHWVGKSVECQGQGCELCKAGEKFSKRFRVNFITKDESGNYVAKIFEGGNKVLKVMKALHDEYNLEETIVSLTRHGERTETTYTLLPAKQYKVEPPVEAVLSKVPLNALTPQGEGTANESDFARAEDVPF